MKVFLPGGAGLVGLNLIALLREQHPEWSLLVVDKKSEAVSIGCELFPKVTFLQEGLIQVDRMEWPQAIRDCRACVMLQAEIGNTDPAQFERNNSRSTEIVLAQMAHTAIRRLVHISSSVVNSVAADRYTQTKRRQEEIVRARWPEAVVLRPAVMLGWFDRKHLGWLARFLRKSPLFAIPGSGRFIRQPLFVKNFYQLIERCLADPSIPGCMTSPGWSR